jgi:hypothetical protein
MISLEDERHDVVVPNNDDHLLRMTGHHASESLERAVGQVTANAEVQETKPLVLRALFQCADPVKASLCRSDTSAEAGHDTFPRLNSVLRRHRSGALSVGI